MLSDMEAIAEPIHLVKAGAIGCKVCRHPELADIHASITAGDPVLRVAMRYAGQFSRKTLHEHLGKCIRTAQNTHFGRTEVIRQESELDFDNRLAVLLSEAEDGLQAAKAVLLVDGDLCFDPRAHEVNVVYADYNDLNEKTNEPKMKTAPLSALLARISEEGYEPKHSFIKAEDMRKTFRESISLLSDLIDRIARIKGYYRNADDKTDRLNYIKGTIQAAALKFQTSYKYELGAFLVDHSQTIRPDLKTELVREWEGMTGTRGMPTKESLDTLAPLAPRAVDAKRLPPSTSLLPELDKSDHGEAIEAQIIQPEENRINLREFLPETLENTP